MYITLQKQFENYNSGAYSMYNDFTPPDFTVEEINLLENELYLSLNVDNQVNKVEISVDGIYAEHIQLSDFSGFTIDLSAMSIDYNNPLDITVYAYDEYLNYSSKSESFLSAEDDKDGMPHKFRLFQNFPNPFNPTTTIKYELPKQSRVTLTIFDLAGNYIETVNDQIQSAGSYSINWDGSSLASGTYIYNIKAGEINLTRKMVLIK